VLVFGAIHHPRVPRLRAMLARYTDGQGALKQREPCERHVAWLKANRPNIQDLRDADP
jgi:hypothetical protein